MESLIFGAEGGDPNAGERYRFRGRALPPPSHRYTPLGFFLKVLRGLGELEIFDTSGVEKLVLGEVPRTGVGGELEKRNGSCLSSSGELIVL